jgi:hypothetical protein
MGIARTIRFPSLVCLAATILGELHHDQGRLEVARSVWDEGLSRVTEVTQRHHYIVPLIIDLSRLAIERGDREAAASLLVEALTSADERSRWQLAHALEAAVEMLAVDNHLAEPLRLAGTAAALREKLETPLWPTERGRLKVALGPARERMGTADADIAWRSGWITAVDQALSLAFDMIHPRATSRSDRSGLDRWHDPV